MNKKFKSVLSNLVIIIFIIIMGISCSNNKEKTLEKENTTEKVEIDTSNALADLVFEENFLEIPNWTYMEDVDKMTDEISYFAISNSPKAIVSDYSLIIMNKKKRNSVSLQSNKEIFSSENGDSEYCRVRFDNDEAVKYSINISSDNKFIFLQNTKPFFNKLKSAKKLLIEASFYNEGRKILEFDVEGLEWNK